MQAKPFFEHLWQHYIQITPQAEQVRQLFVATDGEVINDHVAFRTFANTALDLAALEPHILAMGYSIQDDYHFEAKKLRARSYMHADITIPKIFVSELKTNELSEPVQQILHKYTKQIVAGPSSAEVFWSGRHWDMPTWNDYQTVMAESEYGAWLLAIGLQVNHFTVSVEQLTSAHELSEVLQRVKDAGFAVNTSGGEIKGTPADCLEQGSTMADKQVFTFGDGTDHEIPTCFYEFAKRHVQADGELYHGFIAANADKIFESTNAM